MSVTVHAAPCAPPPRWREALRPCERPDCFFSGPAVYSGLGRGELRDSTGGPPPRPPPLGVSHITAAHGFQLVNQSSSIINGSPCFIQMYPTSFVSSRIPSRVAHYLSLKIKLLFNWKSENKLYFKTFLIP